MTCPQCSGETSVLDSRQSKQTVRRRRTCVACKLRFTTYEVCDIEATVTVRMSVNANGFALNLDQRTDTLTPSKQGAHLQICSCKHKKFAHNEEGRCAHCKCLAFTPRLIDADKQEPLCARCKHEASSHYDGEGACTETCPCTRYVS